MCTQEESYGEENIEFTTQLIIQSYSLEYDLAREWAIKALDSLEAHGCGASDRAAVSKVVYTVVASWLKQEPGH